MEFVPDLNFPAAESSMIGEGVITGTWTDNYLSWLKQTSEEQQAAPAWQKPIIKSMHWASLYLLIRYFAWNKPAHQRNPETEHRLAGIHFETEIALWHAFSQSSDLIATTSVEAELIALCFGSERDVQWTKRFYEEDHLAWAKKFSTTLEAWNLTAREQKEWPLPVISAIRYASFYRDLFLDQNLAQCDFSHGDADSEKRIKALLKQLSTKKLNADSLRLIEIWLRASRNRRDNDGTPIVAPRRNQPSNSSVRTQCELAILS